MFAVHAIRSFAFKKKDTHVVMKNWEPLVLGPALAMDSIIGFSCLSEKSSSAVRLTLRKELFMYLRTDGQLPHIEHQLTDLLAIDRFSAGTVASSEVSSLQHEPVVSPMKSRTPADERAHPLMHRWNNEPA